MGNDPVKDAFAFTRDIIHQAAGFVKRFLKSFLKNPAISELFAKKALTICRIHGIILACEQRRSRYTAIAVSPCAPFFFCERKNKSC